MKKIDMSQGALFTQYFLQEGIKETAEWKAVDASAIASFAGAAKAAFSAFPVTGKPSEKQTEDDLIFPILSALGWTRDHWIAQVPATQKGRADVPDMLLFATPDDKKKANSEKIGGDRYKFGLSIVENKAWGVALDRAGKGKAARDGVPSNQILRYLSAAETQSDRRIRWGVLTNGRYWRLYWQLAKSRAENFLELDLPTLLDANGGEVGLFTPNAQEREHWIKVFVLLFRRQAFLPGADDRSFHVVALAEGRLWEERVAKSLSDLVFKDIFPALVRGLAAGDAEAPKVADRAYLTSLREATLILLYRLLFVLYAEDRNLLPVRSERYDDYALRRMREEVAQRKDHKDTLAAGLSTYYGKLKQLFRAISRGEASLGVPPYNGGLFEPREAPLLERAELSDAIFADVLDALSRHDDGTGMRWINYRDLSVQQLGSIYEQLLEFDLTVENGSIKIAEDSTARRRSGSYYTPEELVGLIIDRTIAPLLEERHQAFVAKAAVLAKDHRPKAERLKDLAAFDPAMKFLELKVCDPAMGSGHFLVSLVDYLADAALQTMADVSATIDWAEDDAPYISPLAQSIDRVRKHISEEAKKAGWIIADGHLDDRLIVRRMILKRVIYGVDRNPMAVELAKVALWLHTFTVGAPLSFLDHHLRCGNSLFGEWVRPVEDALEKRGAMFLHRSVQQAKAAAKGMARVEALVDADIGEVKESASTFSQVEDATGPLARFLDVHHAVRWLDLRSPVEKRAVDAFYDGRFGDPVRVAAGLDAPLAAASPKQGDLLGAPSETMSLLPTGGVTDSDVHATFVDFLSKARTKASEERFLHWQIAYPGVWERWESRLGDGGWDGGFDAVIGNPPYVRQEMLADAKPILKASFASYDGAADLFVYFYEQGLKLLKPGGRLSYVVTNKWMKAGYGEALRRLFAEKSWLETVVDFGHAKQFFADADVFPCVVVARRPIPSTNGPIYTRVAVIARETLRMEALGPQIDREGYEVERERFGADSWLLESSGVARLMEKIRVAGTPLAQYAGVKPYRGILTGFNEAFLIDTSTKEGLLTADPRVTEVIKPYLRGQDIGRWYSPPSDMWMIVMKSSSDHSWPWANAQNEEEAERRFGAEMPSLYTHFKKLETPLRKRQDHGRFWWELRSCAYYEAFEKSKVFYQEIQFHPQYTLDRTGALGNNKTFFLPTQDLFLLAVLNSPIMWWFNWRFLAHMKDEALTPQAFKMELLPIAQSNGLAIKAINDGVRFLLKSSETALETQRSIIDWLHVEHDIERPTNKLRASLELDADAFVAEAKKAKKSLSAAALKSLREEHTRTIAPARKVLTDMAHQERQISDHVNSAYGLTPEDVQLMWDTAPPRMPLQQP